jgi:hypothetical protein
MQHGIAMEDIYSFDETGFAMGLVATTRVVTRADYYGRPLLCSQVIENGLLLLNVSTRLVGHFLHALYSKGESI